VSAPLATADGWRDAPYPRVAFIDDDRVVVAEGSRRTFAPPATTGAATSLSMLPPDSVVVGGARFAPTMAATTAATADAASPVTGTIDPAWAPFGGALWVEPARLSVQPLAAALSPGPRRPAEATADSVFDALEVVDVVDRDGPRFEAAVAGALEAISRGMLEKVVVARRFFVPLRDAWSRVPAWWSSLLAHAATGGGAPYLIAPVAGCALLGNSPERLVVVDGDVRTDAVAGTRPVARAAELVSSDKDAREHALVVEHLRRALHETAGEAVVEPRALRTVGAVAHLHTVVRAARPPALRIDELVRALHPTPAVAGWPVERAVTTLAGLEGFDRGLYGGIVGIVGPRRTALSVALRGALITDDGLSITVGAGVVSGSTVTAEDAETQLKLDAVLGSLGLRRGMP
jgi:isochorismate synthase